MSDLGTVVPPARRSSAQRRGESSESRLSVTIAWMALSRPVCRALGRLPHDKIDSKSTYRPRSRTLLVFFSAATGERHRRCKDGEKLHVCIQRQAVHVDNCASYVVNVESRFRLARAIGLQHTVTHSRSHFGAGIADIDLSTHDIECATVQRR